MKKVEQLELLVFVSDLLCYIGVLFSRHNTLVLDGFIGLLLHSSHKTKGRYNSTNKSSPIPTDTSTSSNISPTSTETNDTASTENSEEEKDEKHAEESKPINAEHASLPNTTEQLKLDNDAIPEMSANPDEPTEGSLMIERPYLSIIVLHSIANLLSDIHLALFPNCPHIKCGNNLTQLNI